MNEFRIRATGQVVTEQEFRTGQDKVFPAVIDSVTADENGLDPILVAPMPAADDTQMVLRDGVVQDALGNWVQAYKVAARFDDSEVATAFFTAALNKEKDDSIAATYVDVDQIYDLAIGRRATEYSEAEVAARAFIADENAPVSGYVSGFAQDNPTSQVQSNLWSAQQIIGRANAFRAAQLAMRTKRFTSQKAMRNAETATLLNEAVRDWKLFINGLRQQLGL